MRFTGSVVGVAATSGTLKLRQAVILAETAAGVRQATTEGVEVVKRNASGAPGPEVRNSGDPPNYKNSWSTDFNIDPPKVIEGQIFTQKPQGQRLEKGIFGTDSLGREVRQFPRPHVRPAVPEIQENAQTIIRRRVKSAVG